LNSTVVRFHRFGDPGDVLQVEQDRLSPPQSGELLVRMIATPINPSDLIPIRGAYRHRISLPGIPGYEGVGVVEDIGQGVPPPLLGKRVLPLRGEGTWQQYVRTSAELAVPVPDLIDDDSACQLYINPITAWLICAEELRLKPDDVLIINAGGSAIARIFAQLSRVFGYKLISVVRSARHTQELLALGVWQVIDTSVNSPRESVLEFTHGKGARAAIDSIGGADGTELIHCTQRGGTVLSIGLLSGVQGDWSIARDKGISAKPYWLRQWVQGVYVKEWQGTFREVMKLVGLGRLQMEPIGQTYELRDVKEAVRAAETPGRLGKVVLRASKKS
jgi:NADPH:quinone reductase-like Zn-dependent oxidoreductase